MSARDGSHLNDNTQDEDSRVDDDCVLSRDDLCEEPGIHCTEPGAEFEDRCEPTYWQVSQHREEEELGLEASLDVPILLPFPT